MSSSDILSGERWAGEVASKLDCCNFGLLCLTRENLESPWLHFEAGAIVKSVANGRAVPLALDIEPTDIRPPLGHFQAKRVNEADLLQLIRDMNASANEPVPETRLEKTFCKFWPDLESSLHLIPSLNDGGAETRSSDDKLEEVLATVRRIEATMPAMPPRTSAQSSMATCPQCHGSGVERAVSRRELVPTVLTTACGLCGGVGIVPISEGEAIPRPSGGGGRLLTALEVYIMRAVSHMTMPTVAEIKAEVNERLAAGNRNVDIAITRLISKGYLAAEVREPEHGMRGQQRRYSITEQGRAALAAAMEP